MNQQDIKKMMEAYQSVVSEKTLTPAEKKKREEIAKAMEKDNPDMPMDKKMAIATAQAKKVEEQFGVANPYKKYKNDPTKLKRMLKKSQDAEGSMRNRIKQFVGSAPAGLKDELKDIENRIKQIKDVMKESVDLEEASGKDIAAKMMKSKSMKAFAPKVAKMANVSAGDLEKMLPDYVPGAEIRKLFEESLDEAAKMSAKSKEWYDKGYAMGKNPDSYKSPPYGIGGAAMDAFRKGRKDGEAAAKKESVNEELWKEIETYAKKHGGIDKNDMMKVAMMLKKGDRKGAVKYARGLDTDPRDWLLDKMDESMKESVMEGYTDDEIRELCHSEDHDCATILIHPEWGMGKPIKESHAIPDEEGFVEWYDVQFKHGIEEKVYAKDVEIVASESHKKKMKEEDDEDDDKKKMDPVNKKALKKDFDDRDDKDIDNDGDVDDSDEYLHKRRKAVGKAMSKDKKGGTAEISKIGEAFEDLWSALEEAANPKKGATPPEAMDSKESPKSKEFAKAHDKSEKKYEDDEEDGHDKTFAAARAGKEAPKRPGDNAAGDKNVVNPVKEDTRTYQQKIMDVLSGKTWGEIANEVEEAQNKGE
jgi:hypothetical protein